MAALLALLSALSYGAGDFLSGLASRRDPPLRVVALTHPLAALFFGGLALLLGQPLPPPGALELAALSGVLGLAAVLAFYRALALGPVAPVSVISGALGALAPVLAGLLAGETLRPGPQLGAGLALVGVALLSLPQAGAGGGRGEFWRGGLPLAVLAGLGFGLFFVLLARASVSGGGPPLWVLAAARVASSGVSLLFFLPLATTRRAGWAGLRPQAPGLIFASAPGDALGNLCYLLAARSGALSVVGLLTNLYPAVTALLAVLVLRERLRAAQWAGMGLALAGALLLAR